MISTELATSSNRQSPTIEQLAQVVTTEKENSGFTNFQNKAPALRFSVSIIFDSGSPLLPFKHWTWGGHISSGSRTATLTSICLRLPCFLDIVLTCLYCSPCLLYVTCFLCLFYLVLSCMFCLSNLVVITKISERRFREAAKGRNFPRNLYFYRSIMVMDMRNRSPYSSVNLFTIIPFSFTRMSVNMTFIWSHC